MTTGIVARGPGLETFAEVLDDVGDVVGYAPVIVEEVDSHLAATIAAGTDPSGKAWAKTQKGTLALRNAKKAVQVRAAGKSVIVELTGHEVFHHYGAGDNPVRTVIPKEIEERLGQAIRRGAAAVFEAKTKAGKRGYAAVRARGGAVTRK